MEHRGEVRLDQPFELDPDEPAAAGIVAGSDPTEPVTITATGSREGKPVVIRKARLPFRRGRIILVQMYLLRSCADVFCSAEDEACEAGACVPIDIDPNELPEFTPTTPGPELDAGPVSPPDAAPEPDLGPDIGPNIRPDIGPDTGPDIGPDIGPNIGPDIGPDTGPDLGRDIGADAGGPVGWVTLPASTSRIGSPMTENCRVASNEDRHEVTLTRSVAIPPTAVTQPEYEAVVGARRARRDHRRHPRRGAHRLQQGRPGAGSHRLVPAERCHGREPGDGQAAEALGPLRHARPHLGVDLRQPHGEPGHRAAGREYSIALSPGPLRPVLRDPRSTQADSEVRPSETRRSTAA